MKKTPERDAKDILSFIWDNAEARGRERRFDNSRQEFIKQALADLNAYYTLSDEELEELLPKKKEILEKDQDLWEQEDFEQDKINKAIESCTKALCGKVKRGLSVEEIEDIIGAESIKFNGISGNSLFGSRKVMDKDRKYWKYLAQEIHTAQGDN